MITDRKKSVCNFHVKITIRSVFNVAVHATSVYFNVVVHTVTVYSYVVDHSQSRYRPGVAQRVPDFMTTAQGGGKVVSLTHRPHLPPGYSPGTHFC